MYEDYVKQGGRKTVDFNKAKAIAAELMPPIRDLSISERREYSVARAIRSLAGDCEAGLEREVSAAFEKSLSRPTAGIYVPTQLRAGLDTKTDAAGKYTVTTQVRDLIELLRNRTRVVQLGATVLSGLSSTLAFPVQTNGSAGAWVAENPGSDVSASDAVFSQRSLSPKMYSATTSYSRKLLAQSSIDVESFVRGDLATAHALAIDLACIAGSGSANQPLGLMGTTGVGAVYANATGSGGAAGAVPTFATMVALETAISAANADVAGLKILTTPGIRGKLRMTQEFASANGRPVWTGIGSVPGSGLVNGYDAWVSNQVPSNLTFGSSSGICHAIIFGYWPSLIIGEWGVIEILVDPYALKKQGVIEVTSYQMVDCLLRQPAQFAVCKDAVLA